jgi:hypothetical protein
VSSRNSKAFLITIGEENEADRSEGRSKRQKEKKKEWEEAERRIRQRPIRLIRLTRLRVNAHIGVRSSSREIRLEEGTNQSSEPAGEVGSRAGTI